MLSLPGAGGVEFWNRGDLVLSQGLKFGVDEIISGMTFEGPKCAYIGVRSLGQGRLLIWSLIFPCPHQLIFNMII